MIQIYGYYLVLLKWAYTNIFLKALSYFISEVDYELLLPHYCRRCGRQVHDYYAPTKFWKAAIGKRKVLCYDCFCHKAERNGLYYRLIDKDF
jgi:hypothetical protein